VTQGALDGVKPFTSNVLRVQLIAKTLENSLQARIATSAGCIRRCLRLSCCRAA
jgi:hypothetical protein